MKFTSVLLGGLTAISLSQASTVFISEFHYDNTGTDTGEAVEIHIASGTVPSSVLVGLWNGSNGVEYDNQTANNMAQGPTVNLSGIDYDIYVWNLPTNGLQNGAPDGIAISLNGSLVEFISYEGTFIGPEGTLSTDVGVTQSNSTTLPGSSIFRQNRGWVSQEDGTNTLGSANPGLTVVPETSSALLSGLALLGWIRRRR